MCHSFFGDRPDSDLEGIAFWSSARLRSASYLFDPFIAQPRLLAQRYTPPPLNQRALMALDATNGSAVIDFDDGTTAFTQSITLGTNQKITAQTPILGSFTMSLTPKTGAFAGSFLFPQNHALVNFGGVLLQKSGEAVGQRVNPGVELSVELPNPAP